MLYTRNQNPKYVQRRTITDNERYINMTRPADGIFTNTTTTNIATTAHHRFVYGF